MIGNLSIQVRLIIANQNLGCARKWSRDFYETSVSSTQSILIDGLIADKGSIKFDIQEMMKGELYLIVEFKNNNYSLNGTYNLKSNLTLGATVNFPKLLVKVDMELDMTAAEMLTVLSDILTKQIMTSRNKRRLF
jgi:hypothetical protein